MSSEIPNLPTNYTINTNSTFPNGIGVDGDLNLNVEGKVSADVALDAKVSQLAPVRLQLEGLAPVSVNASIKELPTIKVEAAVKELPLIRTDSKLDLGLDNIRIRELPRLVFEFGFRPVRAHLPLNYSFSFSLFGIRIVDFSVCGEGMLVTEEPSESP